MAEEKKKNFISKFIGWIKGKRAERRRRNHPEDDYFTNTPTAVPEYDEYATMLYGKVKSQNSDFNIGIVAPYGAGKSSLIETYKKKYKRHAGKSITISLANFNIEDREQDGKQKDTASGDAEIEKSILQQILYKERARRIPHSRVARLDTFRYWRAALVSFFALLAITFGVLFGLAMSGTFIGENGGNGNEAIKFVSLGIMVFSVASMLFIFLRQGLIRKVKLRDLEVELADPKKDEPEQGGFSPLNRFIEEIIYFFQATKYSIVYIEDLERFGSLKIFQKLRELNTMINNSEVVGIKVTFVYAVNDTMFMNQEERAKFFDSTISLSPALTSGNAYGVMQKKLKRLEELEMGIVDDDKEFLKQVACLIPSMRVLKNIINDYILAYRILEFKKITDNLDEHKRKLFALMVYKNIYPKDYADLQDKKGHLYSVLNRRKTFLSLRIKPTQDKLDEKRKLLNDILGKAMKDYELLKIIVQGIIVSYGNQSYGGGVELSKIAYPDGFAKNSRKSIEVSFRDGTKKSLGLGEINNHLNAAAKSYTVENLELEILASSSDNIIVLKKEVEDLARTIEDISRLTFKDLCEKFLEEGDDSVKLSDELFSTGEVKDGKTVLISELARYLLAGGYIAEDYIRYISKTQEEGLSDSDKIVQRKIIAKGESQFDHKIDDAELLISLTTSDYFSSAYVWYFDIAIAFGSSKTASKEFLKKRHLFFKHLALNNTMSRANEFIFEFFKSSRVTDVDKRDFIKAITKTHIYFADLVVTWTDEELKTMVINLMCELCDLEALRIQDAQKSLSNFINNKKKYLNEVPSFSAEKFAEFLVGLDIRLVDCTCEKTAFERLRIVVKHERFLLSESNIKFLLTEFFEIDSKRVAESIFSSILESKDEGFIGYVRKNISDLLDNIIVKSKTLSEEQSAIADLLLSTGLTEAQKKAFIDAHSTLFDIDVRWHQVFDSYILEKRKLKPTWENLEIILGNSDESDKKTKAIIVFVKEKFEDLSNGELKLASKVFELIVSQKLDKGVFEKLIKNTNGQINDPSTIANSDNYAALVLNKNIAFSVEALTDLIGRNPTAVLAIDAFAKVANSDVIANASSLATKRGELIINCNNSSLIRELFENHTGGTATEQNAGVISKILNEVRSGYRPPLPKAKHLISVSTDLPTKEIFFIFCLADAKEQDIREVMPNMGLYNSLLAFEKGRRFTKAEYNEEVLKILKAKGIIKYKNANKTEFEIT